ncbi:MAG TPA: SpoIIE family protein phosphatase [Pseudonocardiaceae bacterium]|nr:SpoIIE family protein phosphatase [Pseudonocardiaceae bacterium]
MNSDEPDFRWEGPAETDTVSEVRRAIQGWGARAALPADLIAAVTLASYEAMANAVEHAYPEGHPGVLSVQVRRQADQIAVIVSDQGRWRPGDGTDARGRGLLLMEGLAKELRLGRTDSGTTVEMRWPLTLDSPGAVLAGDAMTTGVPAGAVPDVQPRSDDPRDRLRGIQAITDTALAALDADAMTQEILTRVRDLLGVDTATVLVYDAASEHLLATASVGLEQEVRQGVRVPYGRGFAGTVAASRHPQIVEHVDPTTVLNPLLWEAGLRILLGVPIMAGRVTLGVLHVGSRGQRRFTDDDVSLLQLAADRLALAMQAQVAHAEHVAATALQRSLMPGRLPAVAGFDFAARYVPSATLGVGGDWHDVFALPGNRIGIVIGDVSGHGLASAVVMGRLRSALRAYALDNESPSVVLDKLDRKAHHFEAGTMATVAYGVIDLEQNRLRFCLAGHLPPVLAVPGQASQFLVSTPDPPIGFNLRTRQRRCHSVDLPPGALVCFYTDGLVERPGQPLDDGMDALLRIVAAGGAESMCATLMARFVGVESLPDDVAVLIAHRANT